ncbi:hypothetical protein LR090_07190 [Candidatus Bipolaricaulota bacterium]|nr:hypothetical protein [Candidatus Bipolaricaulota bacterium]
MRKLGTLLAMLALVGSLAWAGPGAKILIVDQTQTILEAMQLEVLARALLATGDFQLAATTELPRGPHPRGPFQFVVIVPERGEWVWVCTPTLPDRLPPELQAALRGLEEAIQQVFQGKRRAVDPGADLYPALWSAYFLKVGILEGIEG